MKNMVEILFFEQKKLEGTDTHRQKSPRKEKGTWFPFYTPTYVGKSVAVLPQPPFVIGTLPRVWEKQTVIKR